MFQKINFFVFCAFYFVHCTTNCAFISGFDDWQHLNPRLPDHVTYCINKTVSNENKQEKRLLDDKIIVCEVQKMFKNERKKWRNILKISVDIIMFCSRNNLALRGRLEKI